MRRFLLLALLMTIGCGGEIEGAGQDAGTAGTDPSGGTARSPNPTVNPPRGGGIGGGNPFGGGGGSSGINIPGIDGGSPRPRRDAGVRPDAGD